MFVYVMKKKKRIKNKQRRQVQKLHRHVDLNSYAFSGRHRRNNNIINFSRCYYYTALRLYTIIIHNNMLYIILFFGLISQNNFL
jgi:hypothetical protein